MKIPNLKIKEKMLLLVIFLITLVSFLLIIANNILTDNSREIILTDISGKITEIQKLSQQEFNTFRNVVDGGILEASGLVTLENVVSITLEHHKEFENMIQEEIRKVGADIGVTLDFQHQTVQKGLERLSKDSISLFNEIIKFDNQSLSVLSNVAAFNIDTIKEATSESLEIFSQNLEVMEEFIALMQEQNKHDIDNMLAETIVTMDSIQGAGLAQYLVQRLGELKGSSDKRQELIRERIRREFDLQAKVMSEVMKIVTDKVNLAINNERSYNKIIQGQKSQESFAKLLDYEQNIQEDIKKSTEHVNKSLDQLQMELPLLLQEKGERTNSIIKEQIQETQAVAVGAKDKVGRMVDSSNQNALDRINKATVESEKVIEKTFKNVSKQTLLFSLIITIVCVLFSVIVGAMLIRGITGPISAVMQFAGKISQGKSTERLPEGPDEIGEMGAALNRMADDLKKIEEATLNTFNQTLDQVIDCVFMFDPETLVYLYVNKGAEDQTGYTREELLTMTPLDITSEFSSESFREMISPIQLGIKDSLLFSTVHKSREGRLIPVEILLKYVVPPNRQGRFVEIVRDLSELQKSEKEKELLQSQLLHAQKLESVGQLAAGIAHEINTPMQFIGTNIEFLEEANRGMSVMTKALQKIIATGPAEIAQELQSALDEADWEYLMEEVPTAIKQSKNGISRVTSIVKAMKEFSHPSSKEKESVVVNSIIETTLLIARNEWKYVSEVTTDLAGDLPAVPCHIDELGQVILNLLINAAHAIGEKLGPNPVGEKGEIHISTRLVDSFVEIRIRDTGSGIPVGIRERIFDPFFTTKEVGRGTGQGLTISHDVIAKKHGGSLTFETEEGKGTTFIIRLPLAGTTLV
jgi:PAS domain S-box-containing protein